MKRAPVSPSQSIQPEKTRLPRDLRRERRRQILGILLGFVIGLGLLLAFPNLHQFPGRLQILLWSGALGGVVMSLDSFERAGFVLTRRDNRYLNIFASLGVIAVIFLLILWIT